MSDELREKLSRELKSLRDDVANLRGEMAFSEIVKSVTEVQSELPSVKESLKRLRSRGYAFRGDLEETLVGVESKIGPLLQTVQADIQRSQEGLRREATSLSQDAGKLTGDVLRQQGQIQALSGRMSALKREIEETEKRLKALAEPVLKGSNETEQKVKDLHWTLDQFDEATFKLQPEERPIAVARVTWEDAPGGEKPKGVLLFTDHRVLFEQKEERVTKRKFIFFTAESEKLHKLLLDEPIGNLQDSADSTRGWMIADQLLTFSWAPAAKVKKTTFELESGTAKDWDAVIELIRAGNLGTYAASPAGDASAVPASAPPPAAAQKVRWPETCASCAAPLPPPVKGQTSIVCPYCGTGHKVEFVQE